MSAHRETRVRRAGKLLIVILFVDSDKQATDQTPWGFFLSFFFTSVKKVTQKVASLLTINNK